MPIDPTSSNTSSSYSSDVLGTGELRIPEGVNAKTADEKALYRAAVEFERFFVQNMLKQMEAATKAMKGEGEEGASDASTSAYQGMISDQMTQSVLDGGGLGLAATLYNQVHLNSGGTGTGGTAA